jgi:purine-binding chemotaxis protein CheW
VSVSSQPSQLVVFSLAGEEYALPITHVHEIIRYTEPRSVASTDPTVRGVISLRGKILPVYDLLARLGLARGTGDGEAPVEANIVIVESDAEMAGVICDEVEEVITVESEQLDDAPGADRTAIDGIAQIEDRLVVLLNPHGIVAGGRRSAVVEEAAASGPAADVAVAAA